ncbi:hypothetical protein LPJ66_011974, partial [Kickxella alabastrina]
LRRLWRRAAARARRAPHCAGQPVCVPGGAGAGAQRRAQHRRLHARAAGRRGRRARGCAAPAAAGAPGRDAQHAGALPRAPAAQAGRRRRERAPPALAGARHVRRQGRRAPPRVPGAVRTCFGAQVAGRLPRRRCGAGPRAGAPAASRSSRGAHPRRAAAEAGVGSRLRNRRRGGPCFRAGRRRALRRALRRRHHRARAPHPRRDHAAPGHGAADAVRVGRRRGRVRAAPGRPAQLRRAAGRGRVPAAGRAADAAGGGRGAGGRHAVPGRGARRQRAAARRQPVLHAGQPPGQPAAVHQRARGGAAGRRDRQPGLVVPAAGAALPAPGVAAALGAGDRPEEHQRRQHAGRRGLQQVPGDPEPRRGRADVRHPQDRVDSVGRHPLRRQQPLWRRARLRQPQDRLCVQPVADRRLQRADLHRQR